MKRVWRNAHLLFALILIHLPLHRALAGEDWNFTPADYSTLRQSGKHLTLASDSTWFPLFEPLKATLDEVLNPALQPSLTEGVNLQDFNHGHVACMTPNQVSRDAQADVETWGRKLLAHAMGTEYDDWQTLMTVADIPRIEAPLKIIENRYGQEFRKVFDPGVCVTPVLIFHSFEEIYEGKMAVGSPRRNFRYFLKTKDLETFTPPDPNFSSSWTDFATELGTFVFLIDQAGRVHVSWRSSWALMRVTRQIIR